MTHSMLMQLGTALSLLLLWLFAYIPLAPVGAGVSSISVTAAHNFAALAGHSLASGTEINFQVPIYIPCKIQGVGVRFEVAPSPTPNPAKFFDVTLRKNMSNTSTTCRIASTSTNCVPVAVTSVIQFDLLDWDIVPNQTGANPANPNFVSIIGICQ